MKPTLLQTQNDTTLGKFIPDFTVDKVILKNYFYFAPKNFIHSNPYSDEEIALILQLTDTEYAGLVQSYFGDKSAADTSVQEGKIQELEAKLAKSREFEDKKLKLQTLESEFAELKKSLLSVEDIKQKYDECESEYKQFGYLTKYNLAKIHEDLVSIIAEINNLEQKILNHQGAQISQKYTQKSYDKGKIGLAVGLSIGVVLLGFVLKLLESPGVIIGLGVGVGFLLAGLILYSAKNEIEYGGEMVAGTESIEGVGTQLDLLKQKRAQILQLIGVPTSDEFFNAKAKLSSLLKSMKYLKEQWDKSIEGSDYNELKSKEAQIITEMEILSKELSDESVLLKPEEYLSIRREIDFLKLSTNTAKQSSGLEKPQILEKLESIKKELKDKLPDFCNVLKNTLKDSIGKIRENLDIYITKYSITPFEVDEDLSNFETLSNIQKLVLELSLFKVIYEKDYVFVVPNKSNWESEQSLRLDEIANQTDEAEINFCYLNS